MFTVAVLVTFPYPKGIFVTELFRFSPEPCWTNWRTFS